MDVNTQLTQENEELQQLYEGAFQIEEGDILKGKVIDVSKDYVTVDVGYKSEGQIPISEFLSHDGLLTVNPGDEVEVYVERRRDDEGEIVLSKVKADRIRLWERIMEVWEKGEGAVEGTVVARVKGGFTVDLKGIKAFLPGSQADLHPVRDPGKLIGKRLKFKILKVNRRRNNVVLSHRAFLEEKRERLKRETLSKLRVGAVVEGTVKNITDYGAFIDLGGVDGLLHITDISWGRIAHPSERLSVGDRVKVKVIKFDPDTEKISLGMKQLEPDPWATVDEKYPEGTRVRGKVVGIVDYGIFVELEEGVEGLIHISDMSWSKRIKHPSKYVSIGDIVEAVVLSVDKERRRISLGMKQLEPNPWDLVAEKYPVGTRIIGQVKTVTDFGIFIGIEEGIDGLVHVSEMSWSKRVRNPAELYKKGQEVEAVVLNIDKERERFSLGIKQLYPDPWTTVTEKYKVGQVVTGKVTTLTDFGAFVELERDLEALLHVSEMGTGGQKVEKPSDILKEGDTVTAVILHINPQERRMGLSMKALAKRQEEEEMRKYMGGEEELTLKLGELIQEKQKEE